MYLSNTLKRDEMNLSSSIFNDDHRINDNLMWKKFDGRKRKSINCIHEYRKFFFPRYYLTDSCISYVTNARYRGKDIDLRVSLCWVNVHCLASFYSCPWFLDREGVIRWRHISRFFNHANGTLPRKAKWNSSSHPIIVLLIKEDSFE